MMDILYLFYVNYAPRMEIIQLNVYLTKNNKDVEEKLQIFYIPAQIKIDFEYPQKDFSSL